jgi:hypothetical protein
MTALLVFRLAVHVITTAALVALLATLFEAWVSRTPDQWYC